MSNAGSLWLHHVVVEVLTSAHAPDLSLHDRTPSLHPHTARTLANILTAFPLGMVFRSASFCSFPLPGCFSLVSSPFPTEVYEAATAFGRVWSDPVLLSASRHWLICNI